MKTTKWLMVMFFILYLINPMEAMAKGGGTETTVTAEEPLTEASVSGGVPDTVEGPINDKMSDSGKLLGDLYKILRQQGGPGDQKLIPRVNTAGKPELTNGIQLFDIVENTEELPNAIVGGEPVLTVIDPGVTDSLPLDYGWFAADTDDDGIGDTAVQSPFPAQCVQPVASYERWGDISSKTGLAKNRLPMTITYDPTWGRSECEVGQLDGEVTVEKGVLIIPVNEWFIEPCDKDENGNLDVSGKCQWTDPQNGLVTYPDGVLWTALIDEVSFGRLDISRSPEAVLQSSLDEAINNINSPDTIAIEIDASGRLLLTKNVYDELLVDSATGLPKLIGTIKKAIDSPLENIALYVKLMRDGHLVTPGDERMPIDQSQNGGIPLWKLLELSDGPANAALRPTIDINKMRNFGFNSMVNVNEVDYLTYYVCLNKGETEVPCLVWDTDPVQPELEKVLVGNSAVVSRKLITVLASAGCPDSGDDDNPYTCEGPFSGIMTNDDGAPDAADLIFAASHLAAASDKTGDLSVDMVVYLNSIFGINKVLGTSENGDINYETNPVYFNFNAVSGYNRNSIFSHRGQVVKPGGNGAPSIYDGNITVLQGKSPNWLETVMPILDRRIPWKYVGWDVGVDGKVVNTPGIDNILGFTQQADDDLSVIEFIHTYQIPELR